MRLLVLTLVFFTISMSANAQTATHSDPMEGWNRAVFSFNRGFDDLLLKPVARGYKVIVPKRAQVGLRNATSNLREPLNFINSVLQGNPEHAGHALTRFLINSTFGLLGFIDVARMEQVGEKREDFGQTLAVWGWRDSPYFVLPFLGHSTLSDTVGIVVDNIGDPARMVMAEHDLDGVMVANIVVPVVDGRARALDITDDMERNSVDYYTALKSYYLQYRQNLINNGDGVSVTSKEADAAFGDQE
jgi:phospholipid-binding lipoprotein MlaA